MDEMKIKTKFMRSIFARLIAKGLKKGLGINIDLDLTSLDVSFDGEKGRIYLTAMARMDKDEIGKLVKNI